MERWTTDHQACRRTVNWQGQRTVDQQGCRRTVNWQGKRTVGQQGWRRKVNWQGQQTGIQSQFQLQNIGPITNQICLHCHVPIG